MKKGGPARIEDVRVSGLSDYLESTYPGEDWPFELRLLRSTRYSATTRPSFDFKRPWSDSPVCRSFASVRTMPRPDWAWGPSIKLGVTSRKR